MSAPGLFEWLIIAGVLVLLFGVNKLPQLGGSVGEAIKNFKRGIRDDAPPSAHLEKPKTPPPPDHQA